MFEPGGCCPLHPCECKVKRRAELNVEQASGGALYYLMSVVSLSLLCFLSVVFLSLLCFLSVVSLPLLYIFVCCVFCLLCLLSFALF